jgi:hypothetical protein
MEKQTKIFTFVLVDFIDAQGQGLEDQILTCETEDGLFLNFQGVDKVWL